MRFMIMVKEGETPVNRPPSSEEIAEMGRFNKQLIDAGIVLAMEGLHPSKFGTRVKFTNKERRQTIDGPFSETKELIGGFWMIQVKSKEEAIEWARRVPFAHIPQRGGTGEIELRQLFELEDFAPGEAVERHARLQEQMSEARGGA